MKTDKEVFQNIILMVRDIDKFSKKLGDLLDCEVNKFYNRQDNLLYSVEKYEGYRWSDEVYDWIYDNKIKTTDLYNMIDEYQEKAQKWEEEKWKYITSPIMEVEE